VRQLGFVHGYISITETCNNNILNFHGKNEFDYAILQRSSAEEKG